MRKLLPFVAFTLFAFSAIVVQAEELKAGNVAPKAKTSASSTHPSYPLPGLNDNRMDTQWGTATGKTTGQWLQLDWDEPQEICGVVLHATGPWTQTIDVQVNRDGSWVSVGKSGSAEEKTPLHTSVAFKPVRTKSVRFVFQGGAAYYEVEVYNDAAKMAQYTAEYTKVTIAVAGDLRGRLMGTASQEEGGVAVREAEVTVTGTTPNDPWKETAKTGKQGDFEVPLPFAASGQIEVSVTKGDLKAKEVIDCRDISTQLTPQSVEVKKDRLSLCGTWEFAADPPKNFPADQSGLKWHPIKVPTHWEMEGFTAESGRAVYRKTFDAPSDWQGKRVKLLAEAIYSHAQVWVNGRRVGAHEGGFTPFELDITDMVKHGEANEILVQVDARTMASEIDNASFFAYFELAGLWQPIEVFATSPTYLSHLAVTTDFDKAYQDAKLTVEFDAVNEQAAKGALSIRWRLFDPQGKEITISDPTTQVSLSSWQRKTLLFNTTIKSPQSWNAEQPRLYKLVAEISGSPGQKNTIEERVGFREIEIKGRVLTINGKPVKFRGIARLDAHPLMGRALTPEIDRQDMEMIKDANFNLVRATIAPPHPTSLDLSDELGLYVENEGPTCWGNHAHDLRCATLYRGIMCEFLERDRNHPSIVDWSLCNESDYGRAFSMTRQKMTALDPTRIYSATWSDDTLDVDTYHHPISLKRIDETLNASKPVFFDEVLTTFHGWDDLASIIDLDPGLCDYWIEGMAAIQRALNANENQAGAVQFSWVDDKFLVPGKGIRAWHSTQAQIRYIDSVYKLPGRGIVGEDTWGAVDGWRRPRPEYWLSKKLYSPVQIEEKPLAVPATGEPIIVPVENWNQFADLNQYVCRWDIAGEKGESRAQAAPMNKGTLKIITKHLPQSDDRLTLRFYDERGRMIDAYRLSFRPRDIPSFPNSGKPARIVEQTGYMDNASAVRLLGPNVELAYDRNNGELFRALANGEIVLTLGPKLHIQKTKAPLLAYPTGTCEKIGSSYGPEDVPGDSAWCFAGSDYRTEGDQAVLNWKGRYGNDFEGGFEIRMDDAGDAEFRYQFAYKGPDLWAREIGLEFDVPLSFDKLSWDRNAEYSYYPEDHIGRPQGEAVAHPTVAQTIPAGDRPYGLDDHTWGCNDFRSTKRHIYTASLTNNEGQGVQVFSDGSQHVRATVGVHDISLKVLDYYGGAPLTSNGIWPYGPGRLIKTGDVLKGAVRLKLVGESISCTPPKN
jgi:hypothetical protein